MFKGQNLKIDPPHIAVISSKQMNSFGLNKVMTKTDLFQTSTVVSDVSSFFLSQSLLLSQIISIMDNSTRAKVGI